MILYLRKTGYGKGKEKLLLLDDLAVNLTGAAGGVGLVYIDMHGESKLGMYATDNVVKNQGALGRGDLDLDNFLVLDTEIDAVLRSEMDVALGDDHALGKLDLALRADELAGAGTGENTGLADGSGNAKCAGIGRGDFNLSLLADRAEDGNVLEGALGSDDVDTLIACVLTRLGKILFVGELCALAEKDFQISCADMDMAGAGFYQDFILHWKAPPFEYISILYYIVPVRGLSIVSDKIEEEIQKKVKIFDGNCAILSADSFCTGGTKCFAEAGFPQRKAARTGGGTMSRTLEELRESIKDCRLCRLCEERHHVVFGAGVPHARVMLIGEGPGQNEDEQGEPFVGRAGQLLDKMLDAVELSREKNVFIANMVKCRPPKNRDPQPDETEACLPYLREQVRILSPRIIVCLGRIAAQRLISPDFRVTRQHGEFFEKNGTWMMGTFHPAALLRNPNQKPAAFEDWLALQEKIKELCPEVYENE